MGWVCHVHRRFQEGRSGQGRVAWNVWSWPPDWDWTAQEDSGKDGVERGTLPARLLRETDLVKL